MSTGNTHEQRSMAPNAYLPADDPGKNGGATYMGTSQQPAQEDWENIFGPAGREVVTDPQRNKRHQRWHLPDRLKGPNNFLTDRIDGLITDATSSPFTSVILPYLYVENPDQPLTWNTFSYDEGLASRVPYEAAARVLTQTKSSHSAYIVRQGLAISMEHNFMLSPAGRADFQNQLLQLVGSIQYTNDLDCHIALITAPNYERTEVEKYAYNERDVYQTIKLYTEMYGIAQKNANGLDCVIEEAKQVFRKWGAKEPTFLLTNSRLGFQQNMTLERTQYLTNGIDGVRRLRDGPELSKYRGLSVINTRSFSLEAGRAPRDLLVRRVRVAEHYAVPPMSAGELANCEIHLYDEGRDQMVPLKGDALFKASHIQDIDGGNPNQKWDDALALDQRFQSMNLPHLFGDWYACAGTTETEFTTWKGLDIGALNANDEKSAYHQEFLLRVQGLLNVNRNDTRKSFDEVCRVADADPGGGGAFKAPALLPPYKDSIIAMVKNAMNWAPLSKEELRFRKWINYIFQDAYALERPPTDIGKKIVGGNVNEVHGHTTDINWYGLHLRRFNCDNPHSTLAEFRILLPYVQEWLGDVTDADYEKLFMGKHCNEPPKYNLLLLRPTIEHSMIGCVVGRGGAEDLGATLWGQTELSCYDDAMHGKWGMSYKFHARSLVYNEKHLLRLWDVAFAGYHGGMGTTIIGDDNRTLWQQSCMHLDEALSSKHPSVFVMRFHDEYTKELSNPVSFYNNDNKSCIDPQNIYSTYDKDMELYEKLSNPDKARFDQYKMMMPDFGSLHAHRKTAGHASHEGDTHQNSFSFQGTMWVKCANPNKCKEVRGTGHLGHSCCGSSSIRSGKGMMNPMSIDTSVRVV